MGLRTVAGYSEADCGAMHVQMADEAVLLGRPRGPPDGISGALTTQRDAVPVQSVKDLEREPERKYGGQADSAP